MSRKANMKLQSTASESSIKRTERTPLLESDLVESLAHNKSTTNGATNPVAGVSWGLAAFLLVNTALGAGMLNYPYAYNQIGGILAATLIQIVSRIISKNSTKQMNILSNYSNSQPNDIQSFI